MKSYIFRFELEEDDNGRWSAVVPSLPGCAAWGDTKEEAMEAIKDVAQAFVELLVERGRPIPLDQVTTVEGPVVAVVT